MRALVIAMLVAAVGATAAVAAPPDDLRTLLVRDDEQPGFKRDTTPKRFGSARALAHVMGSSRRQRRAEERFLRRKGFVKAANVHLGGAGKSEGFGLIARFKTSAGARSSARHFFNLARPTQTEPTDLEVAGVPGALGMVGVRTANVYWVEGTCMFGAGSYLPGGRDPAKPVVAAVQAVHARVAGDC